MLRLQQIARLSILSFVLHGAAHRRLLAVEALALDNASAVTDALQQVEQLAANTSQLRRSLSILSVYVPQ